MTRIARQLTVRGSVQGVFFRKFTAEKAKTLQIDGLVRNESDGTVYIEAEGEEIQVNEFITWCHEGSPRSSVDEVIVNEMEPAGHNGFHIRY